MKKSFEIYTVSGFTKGTLGLCKMPLGEPDFEAIKAWRPDHIISLTTTQEFLLPDFQERISNVCTQWHHFPIIDFGAPQTDMDNLLTNLLSGLDQDQRVLAHCMGGQGRSGMLIMKLLVSQGESPKDALKRIRDVRLYAVETDQQELWASSPFETRIEPTNS